ncbi:Uncharacterized protein TCM_012011 [Theobroma cacao]|uniref:Uncharacterized protein n=1 Tax=Theobroma cacao TaxID=3641 RepID=A0A061FUZ1_THECC|nr:Uncharacterized protein TCM_012011 [Theobroma cacao]
MLKRKNLQSKDKVIGGLLFLHEKNQKSKTEISNDDNDHNQDVSDIYDAKEDLVRKKAEGRKMTDAKAFE